MPVERVILHGPGAELLTRGLVEEGLPTAQRGTVVLAHPVQVGRVTRHGVLAEHWVLVELGVRMARLKRGRRVGAQEVILYWDLLAAGLQSPL